MNVRPAAFLDRDGVINEDRGYVSRTEDLVLLPDVPAALARLRDAGYRLIVVTNQSGIGRCYYGEAELASLHDHLASLLGEHGVALDAIYHCPHLPGAECDCRKPLPGLLHRAFEDFEIDRARSFIVGDKLSDVEAGSAAGLGAGYLIGADGIESLADCVDRVLASSGSR